MRDKAGNSGNIWPICLPPPGVQLESKNAFVAGMCLVECALLVFALNFNCVFQRMG